VNRCSLLPRAGPQNIFTSRYKLHLPSEAELRAEIRRELEQLRARA